VNAEIARDLVAEIDTNFRTRAERRFRAIGGLSMGGHGALQLAMNHPEVFGVVGAHSPALREHDSAPAFFGDEAYFNAHDPVHLVRAHPEVARSFKLWLDIGEDDPWRPLAERFERQLSAERIAHAWHESAGGHTSEYWGGQTEAYLRFYDAAFFEASGG
jgi:S-formylglutathione hydrolase FrmB